MPYLLVIADRKEWRFQDIIEILAHQFNLTNEERQIMMPAGDQKRFNCHVGWARTFTKKDGYTESTRHGFVRITNQGMEYLSSY